MQVTRLDAVRSFVTLDGSIIRELVGPAWTAARRQSLAEAELAPGGETVAHRHHEAEELYLFTAGRGRMALGDEQRDVRAGDCVVIPPGTPHKLWSHGPGPLRLWCCCAPAYRDDDTELLEPAPAPQPPSAPRMP